MKTICNLVLFVCCSIFLLACGSGEGTENNGNDSININIDINNPNAPQDDESLQSILNQCCGNTEDDQTDGECLLGFGVDATACN